MPRIELGPEMRLTRAGPDRLDEAVRLVAAFHETEGLTMTPALRRRTVETLLATPTIGAFHLLEVEARAVGYLAVTYGYSIAFGGRDAFLDEFHVEAAHRGRGLGRAALAAVRAKLAAEGVSALHLEVGARNAKARRFYERAGFELRPGYHVMSARLSGER